MAQTFSVNHEQRAAANRRALISQASWCTFYGLGIVGTLVIYGLLQERIMTVPYGDETFTISVFLVLCNRVAAVVLALTMAYASGEPLRNKAPLWKYLIVSLANVFASVCQYEALKYVSFAVQMLGKSFKMMPVMVWGILISGKQYNLRDWGVSIVVTLAVTEFLLAGPIASPHNKQGSQLYGLVLLLAFLSLDGLTSTMQEKLFKEHATSKYNQMLYVNLIAIVVSLFTLISSHNLLPAARFSASHSQFVLDAMVLSTASANGQFFIYSQVKEFGALVFAATMNIRQVVSILVSYAMYQHPITHRQVIALVCIFSTLFYKSSMGFKDQSSKAEQRPLRATHDEVVNCDRPATQGAV